MQIEVIAKRTREHYVWAALVGIVFVYPCFFGVSYEESIIWYWLTKAFLFLFVCPVVAYCCYQYRNQIDAITVDAGCLKFATTMPWGRSTLSIREINACEFESIPEVCDHLILTVSEECYAEQTRSRTWVQCCGGKLRFDMMYTTPSLNRVTSRITALIEERINVGEQTDGHEAADRPL